MSVGHGGKPGEEIRSKPPPQFGIPPKTSSSQNHCLLCLKVLFSLLLYFDLQSQNSAGLWVDNQSQCSMGEFYVHSLIFSGLLKSPGHLWSFFPYPSLDSMSGRGEKCFSEP